MALRLAALCLKNCLLLCLLFFTWRVSSDVDGLKEKTLAMIKPDGVEGKYVDTIKEIISDSGFSIIQEIERQLDEDTVKSFYAEHASKSFFSNLVQYITSGPVWIMVIEKENAIADWRALIGPTDAKKAKATHPESVRALCGLNSERNCVHGSDSPQSAAREISFFFQNSPPDVGLKMHWSFLLVTLFCVSAFYMWILYLLPEKIKPAKLIEDVETNYINLDLGERLYHLPWISANSIQKLKESLELRW